MRYVVDVSVLIELKRTRRLRQIRAAITSGSVAVPSYCLKKLEKRPSDWRDWLDRHRAQIEVRLNPGIERAEYARLQAQRHHLGAILAPDDLHAIVIASQRSWPLVMRDRAAERLALSLGVRILSADEWLMEVQAGSQRLPGL